jgi:biopolymer transport protein ExbB
MIDYFLKGGLLMYPLAACSLIALAVIIEKAVHFARARPAKGQAEAVLQAARDGRFEQARSLCGSSPRPLPRLLAAALEGRDLPRADLENRLSRLGSGELKP